MITRFLLQNMDRRGGIFLAILLGLAVLVPLSNLLLPVSSPCLLYTSRCV